MKKVFSFISHSISLSIESFSCMELISGVLCNCISIAHYNVIAAAHTISFLENKSI